MAPAITSTAEANRATRAPVNVPRRSRALRTAREQHGPAPQSARCSATWSAVGALERPGERPSASRNTRSAYAAATGSWVTMTTVWPCVVHGLAQQCQHVAGGHGVQGAGRLVGEHHLAVGDQRPGDRDALLLAAGELAGPVARSARQPDRARAPRAPRARRARRPASRSGRLMFWRTVSDDIRLKAWKTNPTRSRRRIGQPPLAEPRQVSRRRA